MRIIAGFKSLEINLRQIYICMITHPTQIPIFSFDMRISVGTSAGRKGITLNTYINSLVIAIIATTTKMTMTDSVVYAVRQLRCCCCCCCFRSTEFSFFCLFGRSGNVTALFLSFGSGYILCVCILYYFIHISKLLCATQTIRIADSFVAKSGGFFL